MHQYVPAIRSVQLLLDLVAVQLCFYVLTIRRLEGGFPAPYQALALISALLMIVVYQWYRIYHQFRAGGFWREAQALLRAWATVLLILTIVGFGSNTNTLFLNAVLFPWAVLSAAAQLVVHLGANYLIRALRARGINQRRALLVGDERLAVEYVQRLERDQGLGIRVLGLVPINGLSPGPPQGRRLARLGSEEELEDLVRRHEADLVYLMLPLEHSARMENLMDRLVPLHVDVHWVPALSSLQMLNHGVYEVGGQPVLCLSDSPLVGMPRMGKWLEDKVLGALILLLMAPLMLLIAALVKLTSRGPVLFRQPRVGRDGEVFVTYKFRTMVLHQEAAGQLTQAVHGDPRLTPLGAFLRHTSLDELPQLINVLQGRMSIVGPRPHALEHDYYYATHIRPYMLRHRVKPGITGWAQVNGWRGKTDTPEKMQKRVEFDLYYINNWSLAFDLAIIGMTLWQVVRGRNAY